MKRTDGGWMFRDRIWVRLAFVQYFTEWLPWNWGRYNWQVFHFADIYFEWTRYVSDYRFEARFVVLGLGLTLDLDTNWPATLKRLDRWSEDMGLDLQFTEDE